MIEPVKTTLQSSQKPQEEQVTTEGIAALMAERLAWATSLGDAEWIAFFKRWHRTDEAREHYGKIVSGELIPWPRST